MTKQLDYYGVCLQLGEMYLKALSDPRLVPCVLGLPPRFALKAQAPSLENFPAPNECIAKAE